jgi:MYXO-CTERM domain-containing protein
MNSPLRTCAWAFLTTCCLLVPRHALANPYFPDTVKQQLGLSSAPECTLCHQTNSGGEGTVVTLFGKYLMSQGLKEGSKSSLITALSKAEAAKYDGNKNGIDDITDLKQGNNPNKVNKPADGAAGSGPSDAGGTGDVTQTDDPPDSEQDTSGSGGARSSQNGTGGTKTLPQGGTGTTKGSGTDSSKDDSQTGCAVATHSAQGASEFPFAVALGSLWLLRRRKKTTESRKSLFFRP